MGLFGFKANLNKNGNKLSRADSILVEKINKLEPRLNSLSLEELKEETLKLKARLKNKETEKDILPEAFALVREASRRTLGKRHYDVQLVGGNALFEGKIAEMKTGEGKTLVATLPAFLNALSGEGVHIVTVNDYLSMRDATWMGQIYDALGLSVGVLNHEASYLYDPNHSSQKEKQLDEERDETGAFKIVHEFMRPVSRKEAYLADITYGTNHEFGFDYLRDNLVVSKEQIVQREHNYAIVDEIDSILIDEARTPLIISEPSAESDELYKKFAKIASSLNKDTDYTVDEKFKSAVLTNEGINKAENLLGVSNIYTEKGIKYVHHLETAVRAQALFHKDKDYVVKNGEVIIVDPFTGRLQPGRRWSEGLHQAMEAKEGVSIQKESRTAASITFQNYFRFYKKLSGMTGTAKTSEEEFLKVYGLSVVSVPTNKPSLRKDNTDLVFQTEKGKWMAIAKKVKELRQKGQPVLIGTISIEKNELLSAYLTDSGVPHTLLNAKNHEREGELIAQAGKLGSVTVATNMAGRGIDIALGGNPCTKEQAEEVKNLGGLFVLGTERHEARRIDDQLRGRAGRQGDNGETQFYVSLEDDLMRVFGSDKMKSMMGRFGLPEDEPIKNKFIASAIESSQAKIEGFNFDSRKYTLEYDNVLSHQRQSIYNRRRKLVLAEAQDIVNFVEEMIKIKPDMASLVLEKRKLVGEEAFLDFARRVGLYTIDLLWKDHLESMDYLRSSVNLRAYGQREPLVEYKKEGLRMFREMEFRIIEEFFSIINTIGSGSTISGSNSEETEPHKYIESNTSFQEFSESSFDQNAGPKVARNDLCPCGSGKKYKKCGELNTEEHQKLINLPK